MFASLRPRVSFSRPKPRWVPAWIVAALVLASAMTGCSSSRRPTTYIGFAGAVTVLLSFDRPLPGSAQDFAVVTKTQPVSGAWTAALPCGGYDFTVGTFTGQLVPQPNSDHFAMELDLFSRSVQQDPLRPGWVGAPGHVARFDGSSISPRYLILTVPSDPTFGIDPPGFRVVFTPTSNDAIHSAKAFAFSAEGPIRVCGASYGGTTP